MEPYLTAVRVKKKYGNLTALQDASLELQQGSILALLGPNGAGKTTLIKILATLLSKDEGEVRILGRDLDRDAEGIRHLIGYVGQDTERSAYARLTVAENLRFFGRLRGMPGRQIDQQIKRLAESFEFTDQLDRLFVTLSGGQKQTVVILRAFLHNPPLVYLDEPTKGLDPLIARRIRAFLKQIVRKEGKALLLTSHFMSEVEEMADQVTLIQRGRIAVSGRPDELKAAVGAAHFIELETGRLPAATRQRILGLPQVLLSLEREPGWISVGVTDPLAGAEAVIRTLRADGVETGFRNHEVSLEDAFLHYMGELTERLV